MKSPVRLVLAIAAACLVLPGTLFAKDTIRPKKAKPATQENVVKPVLLKISPVLAQDYATTLREPSRQPVYTGPIEPAYQSPVIRHLEFGDSPALRQLQGMHANTLDPYGRTSPPPANANIQRRLDTPLFKAQPVRVTQTYVEQKLSQYPSLGGGILLEGTAAGVDSIYDVEYDPILNGLVLNEQTLYFSPVAPQALAALARAIAVDQRVGASVGEKQLIYGKVPHDSQVAIDLKMADKILANIALARSWLTARYPLAKGYVVRQPSGNRPVIVQFNLNNYRFDDRQDVLRLAGANFDVRVIPTSSEHAPDGGFLPDYQGIADGFVEPAYAANVNNVTENLDYYRRERVVDRTLRYGEVAAFLRALNAQGVDLTELAAVVETETGVGRLIPGPAVDELQAPIDELFAAWGTLDLQRSLAQWSRSAVQYGRDSRTGAEKVKGFAEIVSQRQRLFPRLGRVEYSYEPVYLGYRDGIASFYNSYSLAYWELDGTPHVPASACETYKVRREGGRWLIVENREDEGC
jgi:hypothetical protein